MEILLDSYNIKNDINLTFDDLKVVLEHSSDTFVGSAEFDGENSAIEAMKLAIENAKLDFDTMQGISGTLIHFETHPDFPLEEIAEAVEIIYKNTHYDADVIWGISTSELVCKSHVKVSVLFAGYIGSGVANNNF
jgi:cell division protein FtsZ